MSYLLGGAIFAGLIAFTWLERRRRIQDAVNAPDLIVRLKALYRIPNAQIKGEQS